jgi:hypothetical protein
MSDLEGVLHVDVVLPALVELALLGDADATGRRHDVKGDGAIANTVLVWFCVSVVFMVG